MNAKVIFRTIRWKNFLSYGNTWTEIPLDSGNITVITGKNGSGKSSFLDALYFVLIGAPLREDMNKDGLVNNINKKRCIVEIEFDTKGKHYLVRRGINPAIFEIIEEGEPLREDGKRITFFQEKLEAITGLNKNLIRSNILINSSLKSFFKLYKHEKRAVLDDIFNLENFNKMFEKEKATREKILLDIKDKEHKLEILKESYKYQKEQLKQYEQIIETIKRRSRSDKEIIENKIKKLEKEVEEILNNIHLISEELAIIEEKNYKSQEDLNQIEKIKSEIQKELDLISKEKPIKKTCNECEQILPKNIIEKLINKREKKIKAREKKVKDLKEELKNYIPKPKILPVVRLKRRLEKFKREKHVNRELVKKYQEELDSFSFKIPKKPEIDLEKTKKKARTIQQNIKKQKKQFSYLKVMDKILKDGDLKTYIIMKYIPFINEQFNYYVEVFNLDCKFKFDNMLNLIPISRKYQGYKYGSFSSGQQMRLNLALLYTFIQLAKIINFGTLNLMYNILVLDEYIDHGLDNIGIDDFLVTIIEKNKKERISIFIISHKFESGNTDFKSLKVYLDKGFSKIKEE